MKKFLLFALCAISACSVFAEPFSAIKANELFVKTAEYNKYCYNAEFSKESNLKHFMGYVNYLVLNKKGLTKQQIFSEIEKFKSISSENFYNKQLLRLLCINHFIDDAVKLTEKIGCGGHTFYLCNLLKNTKRYNQMWNIGKKTLLCDGGFNSPKHCNSLVTQMFRYKPASITKEEQIEFLSKLAQMYPIPGTDFNQWKAFMGFVGYKYKALTGKELF